MKKELLDKLFELSKDPKNREELINLYTTAVAENKPLLEDLRDTVGVDLDNLIDDLLKYGAKKSFVAYNAFRSAGFSKQEAMQLTLNVRQDIANNVRNAK